MMRHLAKAEIIELMVCMYISSHLNLSYKFGRSGKVGEETFQGSIISTSVAQEARRIATPDDDINDEDSEDTDKEEVDIKPDSDNPDPVQVVLTKLQKKRIRKMIYSKDHDKIIEAGSLEIGAVATHEKNEDLIRANALIE